MSKVTSVVASLITSIVMVFAVMNGFHQGRFYIAHLSEGSYQTAWGHGSRSCTQVGHVFFRTGEYQIRYIWAR